MTGIKSSFKFTSLCFGLPLTIAIVYGAEIFSPLTIRSLAQSPQVSVSEGIISNWGAYEPDPNIGKPARREGGASRGPCIQNSRIKELVALVPNNSFGATISEYPTFLVYVPGINTNANAQIEFSLQNADKQEIYKTKSTISGSQGVMSIRLPASVDLPPLQVGKTYKWTFRLLCNPNVAEDGDNSANPLVGGTIRRVEPNLTLKEKLEKASSPRDRALAYAAEGIWYDALSSLAQLHQTQPHDSNDWKKLLQSVGLNDIEGEPFRQPVAECDCSLPPATERSTMRGQIKNPIDVQAAVIAAQTFYP